MEEKVIYEYITDYLAVRYPQVLFHWDYGSGLKMSLGMARKQARLNPLRGYPDLTICEPNNGYNGCFIEVKKDGVRLLKKDGHYVSQHIAEQADYLDSLRRRGYYAEFGIGLDDCLRHIDKYLDGLYKEEKQEF